MSLLPMDPWPSLTSSTTRTSSEILERTECQNMRGECIGPSELQVGHATLVKGHVKQIQSLLSCSTNLQTLALWNMGSYVGLPRKVS